MAHQTVLNYCSAASLSLFGIAEAFQYHCYSQVAFKDFPRFEMSIGYIYLALIEDPPVARSDGQNAI